MIESFLQPFRFLAGADFALRRSMWRLRAIDALPAGKFLMRRLNAPALPELECEAFGMKFPSPVGLAAGYDRDGRIVDVLGAAGFGFVEIGSVTPTPQKGSPFPRLHRLRGDRALIYNSAAESAGMEAVKRNLKRSRGRVIVGCNIACNDSAPVPQAAADCLRTFRSLYEYADYFNVNIHGGAAADACDPQRIAAVLEPLFDFRRGQNTYRPVLLKISPDLDDEAIDAVTDLMLTMPLDGITACGGTAGRYGLENSAREIHALGRIPGILCGAPLKPRVLHVVERITRRSRGACPIIACGGITTAEDAAEMMEAGATLVQICTEYIYGGTRSLRRIREGLAGIVRRRNTADETATETPDTAADRPPTDGLSGNTRTENTHADGKRPSDRNMAANGDDGGAADIDANPNQPKP